MLHVRENLKEAGMQGLPIFASAITDKNGKTIAAVGVIDTSGLLQMKTFLDIRAHLEKQLNI